MNRHNINKILIRIFNRLAKRAMFTNTDLVRAIELYRLSLDDMKEIAKSRMIRNYNGMAKDKLYYTLLRSEKSPQKHSYLKYSKVSTNSDLDAGINHARLLTSKLGNKLTNIEMAEIFKILNDLKKRYVEASNERVRRRVIRQIVKITDDLYNVQKQHTKLQHDQTYFGLRDLKYLFTNDEVDYEAIFVRSALENRLEEYEISGNRQTLSMREYLTAIYLPLKKLIDEKQKSTRMEQMVQLRVSAVFVKVNNPFDRYIEYADSDSLILRRADDTQVFITKLYDSLLENFEKKQNSLRGSNLVFDGIDLTLVQFIKLRLKTGGSYIPTPNWISVKKATINPQNTEESCCFAWAVVASIHNEEIGKNVHRVRKLAPFINKYDWSDINFSAEQKDWDRFERNNNNNVALNILSAQSTKKKLNIIRTSKFNNEREHMRNSASYNICRS